MSIGNGYGSIRDGVIAKNKSIRVKESSADKELDKLAADYAEAGLFVYSANPGRKFKDVRLDSCDKLGDKINAAHHMLSFEDESYNNMCWDVINACGGIEKMQEDGLNTSNEINNEALKFKP